MLPDNRACIADPATAKPKGSRKVASLDTQEQLNTFRSKLKRAAPKTTMKTMAAALIGSGMEASRA